MCGLSDLELRIWWCVRNQYFILGVIALQQIQKHLQTHERFERFFYA
jgi:hypothetical protein